MMHNKYFIPFCLILMGLFVCSSLAAQDRAVRLRYTTGDVTLIAAGSQGGTEATPNMPVMDGDQIETGNGRAELAFRNGVAVRVGDGTSVRFNSTYEPMSIELIDGTIFVDSGNVASLRGELEVVSAGVQIYMITEGTLRIDHGSQGSVRVTSVAGEAEVRAEGGRVLLEAGERTYVDLNQAPEKPQMYSENYDELDSWNESRSRLYARHDDNRYVDESVSYDTSDLSAYGDWRQYQDYGNVWVPHVSAGWRPYSDGYWSPYNDSMYWVSYEPWGWAPYHYGRWGWSIGFGWYWIPGAVFAPSWVSWYGYGDYIGWCPLNYWNQPIVVNNYNYGLPPVQKQKTVDVGNAWTFVKKDQIGASNIKNISLGVNDIKKIQIDQKNVHNTPDPKFIGSVLPKARPIGGPSGVHADKNSGLTDIKNRQNETVNQKPGGATPREVPIGKSPEIKQKQQDWEKDRTHNTTKESVDHAPAIPKQQPWKDYTRDNQFDHGSHSGAQGNTGSNPVVKPPKPEVTHTDRNGGEKTPPKNQWNYFDRDQQFRRYGQDSNSQHGWSPYSKPPASGGTGTRENWPWLHMPKYSVPTDPRNNNQREITPRYTDDVRKMFEHFDWNNPSSGGANVQKYRSAPPPPPPSNNHGAGNQPKQHNSSSNQQPPKHRH